MKYKDISIKKKLTRIILLIITAVLLVASIIFFIYEYYKFRQASKEKLTTIGNIISINSTAALAFYNAEEAKEILSALKSEPHIVAACLYDNNGNLFARYPDTLDSVAYAVNPVFQGYRFKGQFLEGFEPVVEGNIQHGMLYLKSDLKEVNERLLMYGIISVIVVIISYILTFLLTRILQNGVSAPILQLAETAKIISEKKDYNVRAVKIGNDELGYLTDTFNKMLEQIQEQNMSLSEINKTLEQQVKELEQFAYVSSHDLQEPLQTIANFVGLLSEKYAEKKDDDTIQYTSFIVSATAKMQVLIKHLLDFSRIGRNLSFQKVDCNKLIKTIILELDSSVKEKNATINSSVLPEVIADPIEIKRLFQNLISNAIKFHKKDVDPVVIISVEEKENEFIFSIKDNGIGFDEKYKDKIFIIFQRLHNENEYPGTGIGLATCKKIVTLHKGRIWVKSKVNEGTTFYFSLPKQYKNGNHK